MWKVKECQSYTEEEDEMEEEYVEDNFLEIEHVLSDIY